MAIAAYTHGPYPSMHRSLLTRTPEFGGRAQFEVEEIAW
jgi:hypothetical protein